jgi:hypothetical protein
MHELQREREREREKLNGRLAYLSPMVSWTNITMTTVVKRHVLVDGLWLGTILDV